MTYNNRCLLPPPDKIYVLLHSMQSCISDINAWGTENIRKLNDNKTELMLVTSKRTMHLHNLPTSITIGNGQIMLQIVCEEYWFYIRLSSYYEYTCLQYCSDMLLCTGTFGIYSDIPDKYRNCLTCIYFFCHELTTVAHCCLALVMESHPTCYGY